MESIFGFIEKLRPALWAAILVACLGAGCSRKRGQNVPAPEHSGPVSETPSQEGWNSSITLTRAGKLQAVIRYSHMAEFENRSLARFDGGVQIDFYDANGQHVSQLTSDRGSYYTDSEEVVGEGRVTVVSDTGITLKTERLRWNPKTQLILSDDPVTVSTQSHDTLYGLGFQSNADLSRWTIRKPRGTTQRKIDLNVLEREAARDTSTAKPKP
jgi:LPS export ABC transporter protein LptC